MGFYRVFAWESLTQPGREEWSRPLYGWAEGETEMTYDVYQGTTDNSVRMATRPGAGLPNHVDPNDWRLMPAGTSQLIDDIDIDIADRDFPFSNLYRNDGIRRLVELGLKAKGK